MIEQLLGAFAEGTGGTGGTEDTGEGGPRPDIGAEEIADILWLAARIDRAAPDAHPAPAADPAPGPEPAPPPGSAPPPPPPPPAPPGEAVQLFPGSVRDPAGRLDVPGTRRGVPLRLPRAATLDDPLGLMRALRPVGRRSIGGPGEELDEQLTVERSIERMVPTPVLRPAESRWLDLALVVDTHRSMLLWTDLVEELCGVLTRSGVFRDVRTWQLTGTGPGGTPMLTRGPDGPPRNPLELADPAGRRLILVLSDTVADGWREAPLRAVLRHWCAHNAVAVLNVLPERLWTRGAVRPVPFSVRADRPAAATRSWQRVPAARRSRGSGPAVPVVGVAAGSLARLVRVVSGDGRWHRLACLRLDTAPAREEAAPRGAVSALEAVERFRAGASPTAQKLAAHLAAVPLTLPVMTLVRRSLLRDSEHGHLAEVALGGLFAPWDGEGSAEEVEFAFLPGVREALLGSQLRGDVAAVRELVRRRIWEYMSHHRGTGRDFSAIGVASGSRGRRAVPDEALPFAARPDPGLGDRVVRVRFDPLAEAFEVGLLLAPRLVLTVADLAARPFIGASAWVRAGGRDVACFPVWSDDASPQVLLLAAGRDLMDPAAWSALPWVPEPEGPVRVRVDGRAYQGAPVALAGEVAPYDGARNGEVTALSPEPESWTHYRGAPVSRNGELLGVVHSVWPDRMVFLSGHALLEQAGFRRVLQAHLGLPADRGPTLFLAVGAGAGSDPSWSPGSPGPARDLLATAGPGRVVFEGAETGEALAVLNAPGALRDAGRILAEVHRELAELSGAPDGTGHLVIGLSVTFDAYEGRRSALSLAEARRLVRHPGLLPPRPGTRLAVAVTHALYVEFRDLLGPAVLGALTPLGRGGEGWMYTGDPEDLAQALVSSQASRDRHEDWPPCGTGASADLPSGCRGIRLPDRPACLVHLEFEEQVAYLGTLSAGSAVDFRGTTFTGRLLAQLCDAVRDSGTGFPTFGRAAFDFAHFTDGWPVENSVFGGVTTFTSAVFEGDARFTGIICSAPISFEGAVFQGEVVFEMGQFIEEALFRGAHFAGPVRVASTVFHGGFSFAGALFDGPVTFVGGRVRGTANFTHTHFRDTGELRLVPFGGQAFFSHAVWDRKLTVDDCRFEDDAYFDHQVCRTHVAVLNSQFTAGATFTHALFLGPVVLADGEFEGGADFDHAGFAGATDFNGVTFGGRTTFDHVRFGGEALRLDANSWGQARFGYASLTAPVQFTSAHFLEDLSFDHSEFAGLLTFRLTEFEGAVTFHSSVFHDTVEFDEVVLARSLDLPGSWATEELDGSRWRIRSIGVPRPPADGG